ncbi:hypothetical protein Y032_0097g2989 [Ancylostoma ceylanicum]|uniref:Uncharacterized protein n=1 Tax=Ancylostoma ceylanicum TaxID=53326 RepID=A0A016TJV8_9BILA|nr:hypothetical protein Y032_0097g2989 [Ancylostoma ceylanicum]
MAFSHTATSPTSTPTRNQHSRRFYRYDYDSPYYYRRYWDSAFNRYLNTTYCPYRYRSTIRHAYVQFRVLAQK